MNKPSDFKAGDIVTIQPQGRYSYHYPHADRPAVRRYETPPPFTTKVLVVTEQALICEGKMMQSGMTQWVRDALQAAGVPEDVRVCLGAYNEIQMTVPKTVEMTMSMYRPTQP